VQPATILAILGGADCERIGAGWLAQPVNSVSSLAYVAVGGWLWRLAAESRSDRVLLVTAGTVMAGVGLGSLAYHGPQPAWAVPAHEGSIAGLALVLVGNAIWLIAQDRRRPAARVNVRKWRTAGTLGAVALAAYAAGRTGSPLCRPDSMWQPHAAWHLFSALALGTVAFGFAEGKP
jgi:hypothetical protein